MSIVRRSFEELENEKGRVNWAKVRATTEAGIERYKREDGVGDIDWGRARLVLPPDLRAIRKSLKLTQKVFASRFGLSQRTVQQWEQSRSIPEGSARTLLLIIANEPAAAARAIAAGWPKNVGPRSR